MVASTSRRAFVSAILAAAAFAALGIWPAASAAEDPTIPAGATSQVALPQSNVLATCTPPGYFHPNPTVWTVNPPDIPLGNLPDASIVPTAGHPLSVTVPANYPYQTIHISWSGNTDCVSFNGFIDINVSAAVPPPPPPPPPPANPNPPLPFSGERVERYCELTFRKQKVGVWVRGLTCEEALDILEDPRGKGGDCFSVAALKSGAPPLFICRAHGRVLVSPGRGRCSPVKYKGRTYDVYRQRVLCRYARSTVLRILRNEKPYIYEFVSKRERRRWRCRRYDDKGSISGACAKRVERRWIAFFPRP
jgi:hypothetical protein